MTRHDHLEPGNRPFLQCFGQQRVVCVREGPLRNIPCLVPSEVLLVQQDTHQLRDGERRMRIIQLDGEPCRAECSNRSCSAGNAAPDRPGNRRRESIPVPSAGLAPAGAIVGIQHSRQRFGSERFGECADKIAAAELLKIEVIRRWPAAQSRNVLIVFPP